MVNIGKSFLIIVSVGLTTPVFGQYYSKKNTENTFFANGMNTSGYGEAGLVSTHMLQTDVIMPRLKFAWQFFRNEALGFNLGYSGHGFDGAAQATNKKFSRHEYLVHGPSVDLSAMPTWAAYPTLSAAAYSGHYLRDRTAGDDNTHRWRTKAHLESYDLSLNGNLQISGPLWVVFTYGKLIDNYSQRLNLAKSKERRDYVSIALRGSSI